MRDSIDWSIVSQIQGAVISSRNVGTACRGRLAAQSSNFQPARDRRAAAHLPQCLKWRDVCAGLRAQFIGYSSGDAVQVSRSQCVESSARTIWIRRRVCVLGMLDDEKRIIRRQAWFCRKGVRGSRRGAKRLSKRSLPLGPPTGCWRPF